MNVPVFVSAFFDIGREDKEVYRIPRSTEEYFESFKRWSKMHNDLIVFTQQEFKEKILQIRRSYGLEDKTKVIVIDDIFSIEKDIYLSMVKVSGDKLFNNYRLVTNAMSNKSKYDYVMLLKYWCIKEATQYTTIDDLLMWIDFGYDHGGKRFSNPEEFDVLWETELDESKITLFALYNPELVNNLEMLQLQTDCIMGAPLLVPNKWGGVFWDCMKEAMQILLALETIDDDQMLLLMVYKKYKEYFNVLISDWFLPLALYGKNSFTIKNENEVYVNKKLAGIKRILRKVLRREQPGTIEDLCRRIIMREKEIRKYIVYHEE